MTRRIIDARLHLLSRQVLDVDGEPVTTVEDLELRGADGGDVVVGEPAHVAAILSGPVLVTRILGGRPPESRWERIAWSAVSHLGTVVELDVGASTLDVDWPERWLREHVVRRIPGGQHDPEGES